MEFKSNQWFGATVRSSGDHILVSLSVENVKVSLKIDCTTELKKKKKTAATIIFLFYGPTFAEKHDYYSCI